MKKIIEQCPLPRNLGGQLIWISLTECMDDIWCIHKVFGQIPTCGVRGVVTSYNTHMTLLTNIG